MGFPTWIRLLVFLLLLPSTSLAGKIVVNNDEWTLSNFGYAVNPVNDPATFATNVADWFTGGGPGTFHAFSTNFGLAQNRLADTMTDAGHAWTTGLGIDFTLDSLLDYDAIFLAGDQPPGSIARYSQTLIDYVEAGGNVYLAGGTGIGGPQVEATRWNMFLNHFGLHFTFPYNGIQENLPIASSHPIFAGVDHLYQANGNNVVDLDPLDPANQVVVFSRGGQPLYAVYEPMPVNVTEPATGLLFGLGMMALVRRRRPGPREAIPRI